MSLVEGMTRDFPSLKLTCPLKNDGGKTNFPIEMVPFQGDIGSFPGGICLFARSISFEFAFFSLFSSFCHVTPGRRKMLAHCWAAPLSSRELGICGNVMVFPS